MYKITRSYPKEDLYGLASKNRRTESSIPINIALTCTRGLNKEFARFVQIVMVSTNETEDLILLSSELD